MTEENGTPASVAGAAATAPQKAKGQPQPFMPITSQEDLEKLLQSETDKRVTQALRTAQAKWEADESQKIEEAKAEAAKLAKMSQDEKAHFELEKRENALKEREAELAKKDLKLATIDILKDKQLPIDFVEFIMASNADTTKSNIESFERLWQTKLEEAVNVRLKGFTPRAGQLAGLTKSDIEKMSPVEINARWDEIRSTLNKNK